jgi:hypothetical protein
MKTLIKIIKRWWWKDAHLWQFWFPGSGLVGGTLMGLLLVIIMTVFMFIII